MTLIMTVYLVQEAGGLSGLYRSWLIVGSHLPRPSGLREKDRERQRERESNGQRRAGGRGESIAQYWYLIKIYDNNGTEIKLIVLQMGLIILLIRLNKIAK